MPLRNDCVGLPFEGHHLTLPNVMQGSMRKQMKSVEFVYVDAPCIGIYPLSIALAADQPALTSQKLFLFQVALSELANLTDTRVRLHCHRHASDHRGGQELVAPVP